MCVCVSSGSKMPQVKEKIVDFHGLDIFRGFHNFWLHIYIQKLR